MDFSASVIYYSICTRKRKAIPLKSSTKKVRHHKLSLMVFRSNTTVVNTVKVGISMQQIKLLDLDYGMTTDNVTQCQTISSCFS